MDNKYEEAKKIYIKHGGNYFFMDRGEVPLFEKYKSFNVPAEVEAEWNKEIKEDVLSKIKNEKNMHMLSMQFSRLRNISSKMKDINGLLFLKDILHSNGDKYDTFTNLMLIETIFTQIEFFTLRDKEMTVKIAEETLNFLKTLEKKPITVSKDYYPESETRTGFLSDEELKERISSGIKEYTKIYEDMKNKSLEELFPHLLKFLK